jgi:hypothetical protein|tara:strand:+ start:1252 stop:1815 length:564 start_codon:yes stop_codon:yes gene_type:complete
VKKIILTISILFFFQAAYSDSEFKKLKEDQSVSYLDFILLKIEGRLIQRHGLLGPQMVPVRVQFQHIGSQVDFNEKDSKIIISIRGVMDKARYSKKKYIPKFIDCNILRNILMYGKQGYNLLSRKRNSFLTNAVMEEMFISNFLNNLSITEKQKEFILNNTFARVEIVDPVRGNNIFCKGKIAEELR